jgi:predicted hotdog family 3-hydroxylacyl-ACP dehydratase
MGVGLPLAAEQLIPHRLPLRLVERLLEIEGRNGVVEALVTADCPLVAADGQLEDVALTELLAQAYATVKGYCDLLDDKPVKQGFLVGIKKIVKLLSAQQGDRLKIHIRTLAELEGFAVAEGEIWRGKELLARGEIKVWVH